MTQAPIDHSGAANRGSSSPPNAGINKLQLSLEIVAIVVALSAAFVSVLAWRTTDEANASQARTEITTYANQMVLLDRAADERNGTQMAVLAEQAYAVIARYDPKDLGLAPATYRVLAQYTALGTENLSLAKTYADKAVALAKEEGNTLEEVRAQRALIDIASQEGDIDELVAGVDQAIRLASVPPGAPDYRILRNSKAFTGALAVYSTLWSAMNYGDDPRWCEQAREYFQEYRNTIHAQAGAGSLEVSRRAYRLRTHISDKELCGLRPKEDLYLSFFRDVWLKNPNR